jgi:hypothetical protein
MGKVRAVLLELDGALTRAESRALDLEPSEPYCRENVTQPIEKWLFAHSTPNQKFVLNLKILICEFHIHHGCP